MKNIPEIVARLRQTDKEAADLIKQLYGHAEALDAATIDPMTIEEVRAREAYHKWRDEQ